MEPCHPTISTQPHAELASPVMSVRTHATASRARAPRDCFLLVPILFGLLSLPLSAQHESQASSRTELRTGPEIDAYERLYYGLFPDITNFERASVRTLPDGAMEFVITRTGVSDTTLRIDAVHAACLERVLPEFEHMALREDASLRDDASPADSLACCAAQLVHAHILLARNAPVDAGPRLLVMTSSSPDARTEYEVLLACDSTFIGAPLRFDDAGGDPLYSGPLQRVPIAQIARGAIVRRSTSSSAFLWGWLAASSAAFSILSALMAEGDSHDNLLSAEGPLHFAGLGMAVGLVGAVPVALISGGGDTDSLDPGASAPLRKHLVAEGWNTHAVPPEFLSMLTREERMQSDGAVEEDFAYRRELQATIARRGVEGVRLTGSMMVPMYNTESKGYAMRLCVGMSWALGVLGGDAPWLLLRTGAGLGFALPPDAAPAFFAEEAVVIAPWRSVWLHAAVSAASISDHPAQYWDESETRWYDIDQGMAVFIGGGAGVRLSDAASLDLTVQQSLSKVVHGSRKLRQNNEWITLPLDARRMFMVRMSVSWSI